MANIKISERYGLNPMIPNCFFCGKKKNEIALLGRLENDATAPRYGVIDYRPCDSCEEMMAAGVMISIVKNGSDQKTPDRTGQIFVVREEAAGALFPDLDLAKQRFLFLEEIVARHIFPPEVWEQDINNLEGGE